MVEFTERYRVQLNVLTLRLRDVGETLRNDPAFWLGCLKWASRLDSQKLKENLGPIGVLLSAEIPDSCSSSLAVKLRAAQAKLIEKLKDQNIKAELKGGDALFLESLFMGKIEFVESMNRGDFTSVRDPFQFAHLSLRYITSNPQGLADVFSTKMSHFQKIAILDNLHSSLVRDLYLERSSGIVDPNSSGSEAQQQAIFALILRGKANLVSEALRNGEIDINNTELAVLTLPLGEGLAYLKSLSKINDTQIRRLFQKATLRGLDSVARGISTETKVNIVALGLGVTTLAVLPKRNRRAALTAVVPNGVSMVKSILRDPAIRRPRSL
jgi:hypothetical protein